MCNFVLMLISKIRRREEFRRVCQRYAKCQIDVDNESVFEQFPGFRLMRATTSMCDCNIAFGSTEPGETYDPQRLEDREIEFLHNAGWDEEQITVRIAELRPQWEAEQASINEQYADWVEFIKSLFRETDIAQLGILIYPAQGSGFDDLNIEITSIKKVSINQLTGELLYNWNDDLSYDQDPYDMLMIER